jgi:hypothetical protein
VVVRAFRLANILYDRPSRPDEVASRRHADRRLSRHVEGSSHEVLADVVQRPGLRSVRMEEYRNVCC